MQSKGNLLGFWNTVKKREKNLTTLACMITDGYLNKHTVYQQWQFPPASSPTQSPFIQMPSITWGNSSYLGDKWHPHPARVGKWDPKPNFRSLFGCSRVSVHTCVIIKFFPYYEYEYRKLILKVSVSGWKLLRKPSKVPKTKRCMNMWSLLYYHFQSLYYKKFQTCRKVHKIM